MRGTGQRRTGLVALAALLCGLVGGAAIGGGETVHKIVFTDPSRATCDVEGHDDEGRILGIVKDCPGCQLELLTLEAGVVHTKELKLGEPSYQIQWLQPGKYTLRVSADGWPTLVAPNIVVEGGEDTRVHFAFVTRKPGSRKKPLDIPDDIERMPDWKPSSGPNVPVRDFKPGLPKDMQPKNRKSNNKKGKGNKGRRNKKNRRKGKKKGVKILR